MLYRPFRCLVLFLKRLIVLLFFGFSIQAENLNYECKHLLDDENIQRLVVKQEQKQFVFKEKIYLFNSIEENEIFAQRRTILLNSFIEFNEKTNMLTEVNSWLYKITKDDYICKNIDSSIGYK